MPKYVAILNGVYTRIETAKCECCAVSFDTAKREAYNYLRNQQQAIYDASMALARSWPCETCGAVTHLSNTEFHRYCGAHMVGEQI